MLWEQREGYQREVSAPGGLSSLEVGLGMSHLLGVPGLRHHLPLPRGREFARAQQGCCAAGGAEY